MWKAIQVRPFRFGDANAVSEVLKASWHAAYDDILGPVRAAERGKWNYSKLGLWTALFLMPERYNLVALENRKIIGCAMAIPRPKGSTLLAMLYVHPEHQGKGAGSALLKSAIALNPKATAIHVEVLQQNLPALDWYERRGFRTYQSRSFATGLSDVSSCLMDLSLAT